MQEDVENVTTCQQFGLLNLLNLQHVSGLQTFHPIISLVPIPFLELTTDAGCDGCSPHSQKYQSGIQESTSTYSPPPKGYSGYHTGPPTPARYRHRSGTAPPSRASRCCAPRRAWPICRWTRWTRWTRALGRRWASGEVVKPWKFLDIPRAEAAAAPKAAWNLAVNG